MTNEYIENELKCPKCLVSHCEHCKCDKCNNTDKPMEWEKEFDEKFPTNTDFSEFGIVWSKELSKDIKQFISQAIQATREETVEEIQKWNFNNGITHKESFVALRNFLDSLTNKSENK